MFAMKIIIFVHELVSVVLTPFVLWFSLPQCAPAIIDFFHDFTVHIPGRGYVCSFAEFDFARHGNVKVICIHTYFSYTHVAHVRMNSLACRRQLPITGCCRGKARWRKASSISRFVIFSTN